MIFREKVNTREASSRFFSPSKMDRLTDAPVAIMLEKAKTAIKTGMMILTAAKASCPIKRPTNTPSTI